MILAKVGSKGFDEKNGLMNASRPSVPGTSVPRTLSVLSGPRHACLALSIAYLDIAAPVKGIGPFSTISVVYA